MAHWWPMASRLMGSRGGIRFGAVRRCGLQCGNRVLELRDQPFQFGDALDEINAGFCGVLLHVGELGRLNRAAKQVHEAVLALSRHAAYADNQRRLASAQAVNDSANIIQTCKVSQAFTACQQFTQGLWSTQEQQTQHGTLA